MDDLTRRQLSQLVRHFYRRHGAAFDRSRSRPWRGWEPLAADLARSASGVLRVLDAGCGNGRFARFLGDRGIAARVLGVDGDPGLLAAARHQGTPGDLVALDLAHLDTLPPARFELAVAFGVLHHLPGRDARRGLLRDLAARASPGGRVVVSSWRFDRDPGWQRRSVAWEVAAPEIDPRQLDPGDHLLSWQGDTEIPRYCHLVDEEEREGLLAAAPTLRLIDCYTADQGNEYWQLERI